jgi:UDP-N-acetyl-2-amino-2-deoxyglucuronate dehydrogenase
MRTRIALIGLGMAVTPHAKSLLDLKDRVEVVAAFSRSEGRRAAFAEKFPFPVTDRLDAILNDNSIAAVGILTPPDTHLALVEKCAAAGKHILLEKPLEISLERSEALVAAGVQAGVTIAVCLQHRFRKAGERLAGILAAGGLGKIVSCTTMIPLWRPQSYYDQPGRGVRLRDGGGVLITQGIHTLDLMLSLAGPVAEVCGYTETSKLHRMETEDLVAMAVKYHSGAIGAIYATTAAFPGGAEQIAFVGTKGTAALTGGGFALKRLDGTAEEFSEDLKAGGTGADPMAFPHDHHLAVWRDFLDAVAQNRAPRVCAAEALKVHRLIEAMIAAGQTDGKVPVAG